MQFNRRQLLINAGALSASSAGLLATIPAIASPKSALPPLSSLTDEDFNPFQAATNPSLEQHFYMFTAPGATAKIVGRLYTRYKHSKEYRYLEWALMYGFVQWRLTPPGDSRAQVTRIHQKLAAVARKNHPDQPAGYVWSAMFTGLEMLTLGIIKTLNRLPSFEEQLEQAELNHADYFYGFAQLLRGKMLVKAPPFPVSKGNMRAGIRNLESAGKRMRGVFGPWYVIYAEAMYLSGRPEQASAALAALRTEVVPVDYGTDFLFNMSLIDAIAFEEAIAEGTYDRYLFDPLLAPIAGLTRRPLL